MNKGLFITGTDTDVGKTWVTSILAAAIFQRLCKNTGSFRTVSKQLQIWKPIQSGVRIGSPEADSYRLKMGSGSPQNEEALTSVTLQEPVAPWMAAERAGMTMDWDDLAKEGKHRLNASNSILVEGAGGLMVPITQGHLVADLAVALELPLLIVARPDLGTVNHSLLTIEYAKKRDLKIAGIIFNGCRDLEDRSLDENIRMVETFGQVPVLGCLPWITGNPQTNTEWIDWRLTWVNILEQRVNMDALMSYF